MGSFQFYNRCYPSMDEFDSLTDHLQVCSIFEYRKIEKSFLWIKLTVSDLFSHFTHHKFLILSLKITFRIQQKNLDRNLIVETHVMDKFPSMFLHTIYIHLFVKFLIFTTYYIALKECTSLNIYISDNNPNISISQEIPTNTRFTYSVV